MIHNRIPDEVARYEQRAAGGLTKYTREQVDAGYAALLAAEAELDAALAEAEAILEPQREDMGLWREISDTRYHELEALTLADTPYAEAGAIKHGSAEMYPLSQWAKAASAWRKLAKRIRREIERLQRQAA